MHRATLIPSLLLLAMAAFVAPPEAAARPEVVLEHALNLGVPDSWWSDWPSLDADARAARDEALRAWTRSLSSFGSHIVVTAAEVPVLATSALLPDPSRPSEAQTLSVDHIIATLQAGGPRVALELRPEAGALTAPEDPAAFAALAAVLAERWDGDLDFGIATPGSLDELPYPDINKTFAVNSSDWLGTEEAEKQAWATAHAVGTYVLAAGLDPRASDPAAHAAWIAQTAAAIAGANPEARVWLGPIPLSSARQGTLQSLLGPALAQPMLPLHGLLLDVDLELTDLGGGDLARAVDGVRSALNNLGAGSMVVVVSGLQVPAAVHARVEPWIRPCTDAVLCTPDHQAQSLIKSLVRLLLQEKVRAGLAQPIGVGPTPAPGVLASVPAGRAGMDEPAAEAAGRAWARLYAALEEPLSAQSTTVPNVRVTALGPAGLSQDLLAWYDWQEESAPPWAGIEKRVTLAAPVGAARAELHDLQAPGASAKLGDAATLAEADRVLPVASGAVELTLRDRPVLVRFAEVPVASPDAGSGADAREAEATDTAPGEDLAARRPASGSGSCTACPAPAPPRTLLGLLLLLGLTGRRYITSWRRSPRLRR